MHCLNLKIFGNFNSISLTSRLSGSIVKENGLRLNRIVACGTSGQGSDPIEDSSRSSFLTRTETHALLKQQLEVAAKSECLLAITADCVNYLQDELLDVSARLRDSLKLFEEEEPFLRLQRLLKDAIAEERFEDAAKYRDELKEIAPYYLLKCSSDATTLGIRVQVRSVYTERRSRPSRDLYFFAYRIRITNNSDRTVQLLRRHWIITDANGKAENVHGIGVIGEQPVLLPNTSFEYSSACQLSTPIGRLSFINAPTSSYSWSGSALSPFLFAIVMDELTRGIQNDVLWCMMFADDIVLIDETKVGVQQKLELWRDTLEARGFRLSRSKTEYMECRFSDNSDREAEMITFDGKVVHGSTFFWYLGSIIQKDGELDGDVAHRIKAGWLKWKSATGVLCDPDMPHRLKGKFYRTAIRPALLYGTECWAVKQCHVQKMNVAEMRMLRWMCGHTKKDRLRNEVIREKVRVASIEDKMMENRLRWFGHVRRRPVDAPVRRLESWGTSNIVKGRGRPKKTWIKLIENDMRFLGIGESMAMERQIWRERIRVVDEI
ncbi:hypothetical protein OROMI_007859 [Orobanche minor]